MKQLPANSTELKCPACDGTGFPKVTKAVPPGHKIYPAPCKECSGKGRIPETAD
jgi:DnaJ-class molecular chaperone